VTQFLFSYGQAFNLIFGTTGNILTLLVLSRRRMRQKSPGLYLLVLSATDLIVILLGLCGRHVIRGFTGIDLTGRSLWYCRVWYHLVNGCICYNHWVLAGVSFERCLAILFPLKSLGLIGKRNAKIYLIASFLCSIAYVAHSYRSYALVPRNDSALCVVDEWHEFAKNVRPWLDFIVVNILPAAIICVCNGVLIFTLRKRSISDDHSTLKDDVKSVLPMLVLVSMAYLILVTPSHINYIVYTGFFVNYNSDDEAIEGMAWAIGAFLVYFNHAVNFLLYLVSGSDFRMEFKAMFGFKRGGRGHHASIKDLSEAPTSITDTHI
jgi:hypothetical protein